MILLLRRTGDGDGRIERALVHLHLQLRDVDAELGRIDRRIFGLALRHRKIQRSRRQPVDRRAGGELAGIEPDHAAIDGARGGEIGLRGQHLRLPRGDARFGLGHVGARDFADIEAVAGLAQLLLEHFDVAPLQIVDGAVAQHVHIGGRGVQQHGLLDHAQSLARGEYLRFGLAGPIAGLEAVEQGLRHGRAVTGRVEARHLAIARADGADSLAGRSTAPAPASRSTVSVQVTPLL